MEKIKCLMKNIDEEISDAWKYADRAVTWDKAGLHEAASIFSSLAKSEVEHAAMNERIMDLVADLHHDHAEKKAAIELLQEVVHDRIEKTHADIREMLSGIAK